MRRYEKPLFAYLSRLLGSGAHVEDIAQNAFLRAISEFHEYDFEMKPLSWLISLARARYIKVDTWRRERRNEPLELDPERVETALASGDPEANMSATELGRDIARAIESLPSSQREAFLLWADEVSISEIARVIRCGEPTTKSRIRLAKNHLRERLGIHWPEPDSV